MLMVGAGAMASPLITAHSAVRPSLCRVTVWNRDPGRAQRLVEHLTLPGVEIATTTDLAGVAGQADLICCATRTSTPVIQGEWLRPGTHLDLVGAFTREMREADDEALRRGLLYVDSRQTTIEDIGEIAIPVETGVISAEDVRGDLYDLCRGTVTGREHPEDITVFKNGGGGHLDLMTAQILMSRIKAAG